MRNGFLGSGTICVIATFALLLPGFFSDPAFASETSIDFTRDVKPILTDNCFLCHGPDAGTRESGLRLDVRDSALRGGDSEEPAIVPGRPDESALLARITSKDSSSVMPPPDSKKQLTPEQVETLKAWIAGGAKYDSHWAFTAPVRPAAPAVANRDWPKNDIDRFVAARLESEKLQPSAEAERARLLRRLSLDLVGLPPSPAELDAFLADASPDAYEKQVDRLLASPQYGEKWARHWLDLARYSDSDGYEKDLPRNQWVWRDWVIKAINNDLPYDQFIIEQIAGDLLPGATQDQRVATGFLRNGMVNEEGAIVAEQFRLEGLFDRLDCIGKSVLGLTIQCAQCHTHKFDPITHHDYYSLMAFLNNDYEATTWVYSNEQLEQIRKIETDTRDAEERLKAQQADWPQKLAVWKTEQQKPKIEWENLKATEHEWIGGLAHPERLPDDSILTLGFRPSDGEMYVIAETAQPKISALRFEALTHGDLPFGGPGRSAKGTFAVSELVVETRPKGNANAPWQKVTMNGASADFEQAEQPIAPFFRKGDDDKRTVGPAAFLIDGKDETAWGTDRGPGRRHRDLQAVLRFEKPIEYPAGAALKITLRFKHSGADIHGRHNNFLGRFRLAVTPAADAVAEKAPANIRAALVMPADQRTPEQQAELFSHWRTRVADFKEANDAIEKLWMTHPEGEPLLNLADRRPEHRRETAILDRGNWQKPTERVTENVPGFLHSLPADAPKNRLGLARWLVDRRSPTTARVAVNRVWQTLFGTGLVETPDDFGVRASQPSHPELLDWLAVQFMDEGWSMKRLLRTIVTSATYRQSSKITPELYERDPQNRLLARGPRIRVEAEMIRDIALSSSGLLHQRLGGRSFFPPVPESMFALSYLKVDFWETASAPERYRRSLYQFRRRSMPDPMLATFDAPNGDVACARRARSNTPLAALAGLNEPVMVEAARALALRVLREAGKSDQQRAQHAFRLCTGRVPTEAEVTTILSLIESRKKRIAEGWLSTREVATGDAMALPVLPEGVNPTEAAAWTIVSRVLLNLDETITKN